MARANAGLDGVDIGLPCLNCGQPITVTYMAHGSDPQALVSNDMQALVAAACRAAIFHGESQQLCQACFTSENPAQKR